MHPERTAEAAWSWRSWALLSGVLLANELGWNLFRLWRRFHNAKVLNSLSDDARGALGGVGLELLGMTVLAGLLLAAVAGVLLCVVDGLGRLFGRSRLRSRAARMAVGAAVWLITINAWYSLHGLLIPASGLAGSPLSILSGALLPRQRVMDPSRVVATLACLPMAFTGLVASVALSRRTRRHLLGGGLATAALVLGFSAWTAPGPAPRLQGRDSVVVLGVDSLQANRLAHGGGRADLAPHIDAFLADCQRFDNAWTPFARTYPSWLSLLTGRYPMGHGIRFNLLPDSHLAEDNPYLPQLLADAGYHTLHATDEVRFCILRERFGYEDLMHPPMGIRDFFLGGFFDFSAANLARQTHLGHALFPAIAHNRAAASYAPDVFARDLVARLYALPADQPLFVSAHLCGNHWPFHTPAAYHWAHDTSIEASIAMVDDQVGVVLDALDATGLLDEAVVTLLSDHGDGWNGDPADTTNTHGDHLERLLANQVLLGLRAPGLDAEVHDELVRTIDLMPTLLELTDQPVPETVDGRSLLPLVRGERDAPRPCFAESGFDKKTFTVARLVEEQSRWYRFDPASGLVTLVPDQLDELFDGKSYMLMEDDLRLLYVPCRAELRALRWEPSGAEQPADDVPDAVVEDMLWRIVEHYELDAEDARRIAIRRGVELSP